MDRLISSYVSMDGESGMEQSTEPLVRRGRGARGRDGVRRGRVITSCAKRRKSYKTPSLPTPSRRFFSSQPPAEVKVTLPI